MQASSGADVTVPRVAVVDDDASFLRALERLLRAAGYAVDAYPSGRAFLDAVAFHRPHCVVLDVQMPEMSGLEVEERLGAMKLSLPVILITAHDSPPLRERSRQFHPVKVLVKPFTADALLEVLARVIH